MAALELYKDYSRQDVHAIFSPHTRFTPNAGTWGLQGIVSVPNTNDYVFFVTIGSKQGDHSFSEGITDDGILTWQSQPKNTLRSTLIQNLIHHNDVSNNIYLFYRVKKSIPTYTYLGKLSYLFHDDTRENPVHFHWKILEWTPSAEVVQKCEIGDLVILDNQLTQEGVDRTPRLVEKFTRPITSSTNATPSSMMHFNSRHINFAQQHHKNTATGSMGEDIVLKMEKDALIQADCPELASAVFLTREKLGDNAPYDIHSFSPDGSVKYIEVKTTAGGFYTDFYISRRELEFYRIHQPHYYLYRIYNLDPDNSTGDYFIIRDLEELCIFEPANFRVKLKLSEA